MRIPTREELANMERVHKGDATARWWDLVDKYRYELKARNQGVPDGEQVKIIRWGYTAKKWLFLELEKFEKLTPEETEVLEFYRTKAGGYEVIVGPVSMNRIMKIFHGIGE